MTLPSQDSLTLLANIYSNLFQLKLLIYRCTVTMGPFQLVSNYNQILYQDFRLSCTWNHKLNGFLSWSTILMCKALKYYLNSLCTKTSKNCTTHNGVSIQAGKVNTKPHQLSKRLKWIRNLWMPPFAMIICKSFSNLVPSFPKTIKNQRQLKATAALLYTMWRVLVREKSTLSPGTIKVRIQLRPCSTSNKTSLEGSKVIVWMHGNFGSIPIA